MVNPSRSVVTGSGLYWSRPEGSRAPMASINWGFGRSERLLSAQADIAGDCLFACPTTHPRFGSRRQLPNFIRHNRRPWPGQGYGKLRDKSDHA